MIAISDATREKIKRLYVEEKLTSKQLAERFGLPKRTIESIVTGLRARVDKGSREFE